MPTENGEIQSWYEEPPEFLRQMYGEVSPDGVEHYEAVVPGTSHGLLVEKPELCNLLATAFLATDPVPAFAPIRRRPVDQSV